MCISYLYHTSNKTLHSWAVKEFPKVILCTAQIVKGLKWLYELPKLSLWHSSLRMECPAMFIQAQKHSNPQKLSNPLVKY